MYVRNICVTIPNSCVSFGSCRLLILTLCDFTFCGNSRFDSTHIYMMKIHTCRLELGFFKHWLYNIGDKYSLIYRRGRSHLQICHANFACKLQYLHVKPKNCANILDFYANMLLSFACKYITVVICMQIYYCSYLYANILL